VLLACERPRRIFFGVGSKPSDTGAPATYTKFGDVGSVARSIFVIELSMRLNVYR
jgi:hypothetical protein